MNHIISLIWLASWPILIFVIYRLIYEAVKRKGMLNDEKEED